MMEIRGLRTPYSSQGANLAMLTGLPLVGSGMCGSAKGWPRHRKLLSLILCCMSESSGKPPASAAWIGKRTSARRLEARGCNRRDSGVRSTAPTPTPTPTPTPVPTYHGGHQQVQLYTTTPAAWCWEIPRSWNSPCMN